MTNGAATVSARVSLKPGEREFPAGPGESLLEAGRRAGFTFPQACRNGTCLRCEGDLLAGEVVHLRSGERLQAADGPVRVLPCIVTACGDCALSVEGVFGPGELPLREVAAQVVEVVPASHNVVIARLRLPAGKPLARLAGQYLEILDGDDAFAFSIASPPESGREIELHVRHGDDNPASLRVLALLRERTTLRLRLPQGDCTLAGEPRLPLLFLAGSTGFAQVKACVEHALARRWQVPVSIYWGARRREDLYLRALAEQWPQAAANVRFVPVLSGDADAPGVRHGQVHQAALADAPDTGNLLVYACGSPAMVHTACAAFVAAGLPRERFFSDVFAWAPMP